MSFLCFSFCLARQSFTFPSFFSNISWDLSSLNLRSCVPLLSLFSPSLLSWISVNQFNLTIESVLQLEAIFLIISSCALNISVKSSFIVLIDTFSIRFSGFSYLLLSSINTSKSLFTKSSFST